MKIDYTLNTQKDKSYSSTALKLILILTILQLTITLLTTGFVLSFDEAMWHYIGRNWFRNHLVPYSGGVDNKSPLIFAIFGLSDRLFGVNYWFPRIIGTVCSSTGIFYLYKIARYIAGERAGLLTISFYGLSLLWIVTGGRYVSFTETFDVLFVILAFYVYLTEENNRGLFISGALAGIALGFRLSAVFGIITLSWVAVKKNPVHVLVFWTGVLFSVLMLIFVCFVVGIKTKGLFINGFLDNFGSGSTTDHAFTWKLETFVNKFFYSELLSFYPFLAGYIFIKRKLDLYILWLILELVGLMVIGTFGALHLKELLPPLSLISAFFCEHIIASYNLSSKKMLLGVWILFLPKLIEPFANLKKVLTGKIDNLEIRKTNQFTIPDEATRKRLGIWVKTHTHVKDKVFIAGFGAQIQVYSERVSPTIYFNATQTKLAKQTLFNDLNRHKPYMILIPLFPDYQNLVSADIRNYIDNVISHNYQLQTQLYSYNIYCLR